MPLAPKGSKAGARKADKAVGPKTYKPSSRPAAVKANKKAGKELTKVGVFEGKKQELKSKAKAESNDYRASKLETKAYSAGRKSDAAGRKAAGAIKFLDKNGGVTKATEKRAFANMDKGVGGGKGRVNPKAIGDEDTGKVTRRVNKGAPKK